LLQLRSVRLELVRSGSTLIQLQRSLASWIMAANRPAGATLARAAARRTWMPYFESLGLIALITFIGLHLERRIAPTNVAMLYLLAVVISALRWGRGPALLSAITGAATFDFFMIPAFATFGISDVGYLITLASLLIVGLLISSLASEARERAMLQDAARQTAVLRQTDKMQKALLDSISHNLRTPLATVTGALQSLRHDSAMLDEQTRMELLANAEEQAARLNRLVGNLLDMTRLEAGTVRVKREPCDILDVIEAALDQLGETARGRQIRLDLPPEQILVALDFALTSQVLVNLLDNALKYAPADQSICIRVRSSGANLEIAVLDRGPGIGEGDLELVFEKFHRAGGQAEGSGLGLSICRGFVEAHGGRIWAQRRAPTGTIVSFTIPTGAGQEPSAETEDERTRTAGTRD
jgi:two-component system sensor histidine kinase KdpD